MTYKEFIAEQILKDPQTKTGWSSTVENHRPRLISSILDMFRSDETQMAYVIGVGKNLNLPAGTKTWDESDAEKVIEYINSHLKQVA